jgi:hypothetical protein
MADVLMKQFVVQISKREPLNSFTSHTVGTVILQYPVLDDYFDNRGLQFFELPSFMQLPDVQNFVTNMQRMYAKAGAIQGDIDNLVIAQSLASIVFIPDKQVNKYSVPDPGIDLVTQTELRIYSNSLFGATVLANTNRLYNANPIFINNYVNGSPSAAVAQESAAPYMDSRYGGIASDAVLPFTAYPKALVLAEKCGYIDSVYTYGD